jgi:hypothetical protein
MSVSTDSLASYAQQKRLSAQILARWQAWDEADQHALLSLAQELQLGENHLRDFVDWLEEIVLRDGGSIGAVLDQREIQRPLTTKQSRQSRNDRLKAVKDALRKLRYPHIARLEEELHKSVKALDLGRRVHIAFPPAFEGDEVTFEIKVRNVKDLVDSLSRLQQRIDDQSLQHLFDLLDEA